MDFLGTVSYVKQELKVDLFFKSNEKVLFDLPCTVKRTQSKNEQWLFLYDIVALFYAVNTGVFVYQ